MDLLTILTYSAVSLTSITFLTAEFLIERKKYLKRKYERIADLQAKLGEDVYDQYDFEQLSDKELAKLDRRLTKDLHEKRQAELDGENRQVLENLL
mgnify:CR=1 FL=1